MMTDENLKFEMSTCPHYAYNAAAPFFGNVIELFSLDFCFEQNIQMNITHTLCH